MFRLLYIYNQLQDNISNTQNVYNQLQDNISNTQTVLNDLYRRQTRVESLIYRALQTDASQVYQSVPNNNLNEPNINNNTLLSSDVSQNITTSSINNNSPLTNSQSYTYPTNEPNLENTPLTELLSNIFNNLPNYLPTQTTSSVNPNYRPSNSAHNYVVPPPQNRNIMGMTEMSNMGMSSMTGTYERPSSHLNTSTQLRNLIDDSSNNYISRYLIYRPPYNNMYVGTNVSRSIIETMLETLIDISNNNISESLLTTNDINQYTKCCEFKDLVNPLNTTCPITMDAFQLNTKVIQLINCGHIFTESELRIWFVNKRVCPICRNPINQSI